eukprot:m.45939 g.45939  ORF g.45939 m.45939 type:complete len:191 (-) comp47335_c0_seq1:45-617(-)
MSFRAWGMSGAALAKRPWKLPNTAANIKWKIFTGDKVEVIGGPETGKQGTVVAVLRRRNKLIVEGVAKHRRMMKKTADNPGGIFTNEAPIDYSRVALLDPVDNAPTKVRWGFLPSGEKVRISKRSDHVIPKPIWTRRDFKSRNAYLEGSMDTKATPAVAVTYKPQSLSFEEEILQSLSITLEPTAKLARK